MDKQLYLDLVTRLKTEIPALRWFDVDCGQLNEEQPPVAFPCALIDIEYPQCTDESKTIQLCNVKVTIRFAFQPSGQATGVAPILIQEKALAAWNTLSDCYSALQGWGTSAFSSFSRRSQTTERRRDKLKVIVQVWETTCEEEV